MQIYRTSVLSADTEGVLLKRRGVEHDILKSAGAYCHTHFFLFYLFFIGG